jgi:hypothetical protein
MMRLLIFLLALTTICFAPALRRPTHHQVGAVPRTGSPTFRHQAANETQDNQSALKRKADALLAFLAQTKDKRVEKTVLRKYNWAGAAKEEALNYNIKISEAKYTVILPGRDMPEENYIVFLVKLLKTDPGFLVADDNRDGSVDRASIQNKKATSEERREFDVRKQLGAQQKEFWQGQYAQTVDALCQHLNAVCGN